jgi:hypothetical protein
VDDYRDSGNPVAARLFRPGHKSKDSANGGWIHILIVFAVILIALNVLKII